MGWTKFHRKKQIEKLCAKAKANLLFLPDYSPDFNLVEKDWTNMR
jgi:transposase